MYKILIVEDDMVIANSMKSHIEAWGWEAEVAEDFRNVRETFIEAMPHLVLLDISLPFFNGYYWCDEIRKLSKVPVIFISSASDNLSIVMAVNMGGDDFIAKPFDLNVLTAKIQAMLRRTYDFSQGGSRLIQHKGLLYNYGDGCVVYQGNKIELTKNEGKILQILLEQKGKIVSRDTVMTRLWETDSFVDDNTLTVNVARLRKKLEAAGVKDFIKTKKGAGYLIEGT